MSLQLDVVDALEHSGFLSVRQHQHLVFLVYLTHINFVLDGSRGARDERTLVLG